MKINKLEAIIGILLIIIALAVGIIELSNYKISNFQKIFMDMEFGETNYHLELMQKQVTYLHFDLYNMIQPSIFIDNSTASNNPQKDIANKFLRGELTKEEYLFELKEAAHSDYLDSIKKVNGAREELRTKYNHGTIWENIRNIAVLVEFGLIIITFYLYVLMLRKSR